MLLLNNAGIKTKTKVSITKAHQQKKKGKKKGGGGVQQICELYPVWWLENAYVLAVYFTFLMKSYSPSLFIVLPSLERYGFSKHQHLHCLFNCVFRIITKETWKLLIIGLRRRGAYDFPSQRVGNAESFSIPGCNLAYFYLYGLSQLRPHAIYLLNHWE